MTGLKTITCLLYEKLEIKYQFPIYKILISTMLPNLLSEIQDPNILEISSIHHSINVLTDKATVPDIYPKNIKNLIQGVFR